MDNRANILDCALRLFAGLGYEAVGVQEICTAAAITKPTLYHYFGSKLGLLEALLKEHYARFEPQLHAAAAYSGDLPLNLANIARMYFRFATSDPDFYRLVLAMNFAAPGSEPSQAVSAYWVEQHQLLEALFAAAVNDHGNMRGRQRAYAATFLGMLNTYIVLYLNHHLTLDEALTRQAVHQFMHGIFS